SSRLIARLGTLEDPQLRTLVGSLTAACASRPLEVSLPAPPIAGPPIARHRFWWVSSPTPDTPPPAPPATRTAIAVARTAAPFRAAGEALRAWLYPAALAVQRTLNRKYRIRVTLRSR